jgi:hypothetical protein
MTTDSTVAEIKAARDTAWAWNSIATCASSFPIAVPLFGNLAVFSMALTIPMLSLRPFNAVGRRASLERKAKTPT